MANKIQLRRDTAAAWTSINPTLADGELGFEADTKYAKVGDGTTPWRTLAYLQSGPAVSSPAPPSPTPAPPAPTPSPPAPTPPAPSPPAPTPPAPSPPAPSAPDTRPRFLAGGASATAATVDAAALLASMTVRGNSTNGSLTGDAFTTNPVGTGQYAWAAFEATASAGGVTFSTTIGPGDWQGAGSSGDNFDDPGTSPNTSTVTATVGGVSWRFFRHSYQQTGDTYTTA